MQHASGLGGTDTPERGVGKCEADRTLPLPTKTRTTRYMQILNIRRSDLNRTTNIFTCACFPESSTANWKLSYKIKRQTSAKVHFFFFFILRRMGKNNASLSPKTKTSPKENLEKTKKTKKRKSTLKPHNFSKANFEKREMPRNLTFENVQCLEIACLFVTL